ncbi:MAG: hypothetical protein K6F88_00330 [Ruminococcus sp.]|nr:hypothetical protein [Ruminococcus sp.]
MINADRIVPVIKTDLLSLYGTILKVANVSFGVVEASTVEGDFTVTGTGAAGTFLGNQPVKTLDFATGVTSATVYFVAAYDFGGFTVAGAAATTTGTVTPDDATLYKAELSGGTVTVTAVTP